MAHHESIYQELVAFCVHCRNHDLIERITAEEHGGVRRLLRYDRYDSLKR